MTLSRDGRAEPRAKQWQNVDWSEIILWNGYLSINELSFSPCHRSGCWRVKPLWKKLLVAQQLRRSPGEHSFSAQTAAMLPRAQCQRVTNGIQQCPSVETITTLPVDGANWITPVIRLKWIVHSQRRRDASQVHSSGSLCLQNVPAHFGSIPINLWIA